MEDISPIRNFLDADGKLKSFPAKRSVQVVAFEYLSEKFEYDRQYTEQEVNAIIAGSHTFNDIAMLRRGMIETGFLKRTPDGKAYWRVRKQ